MLSCYLKHNKSVYKQFKSSLGGDSKSKKRSRANSNVSNGSASDKKKRDKKKMKKALDSKKSSGMMTRRKSSVDLKDWKPKTEEEIIAECGPAKEHKF